MGVIYTIGIQCYGLLIRVASLFNHKARKWVIGRKNWEGPISQFQRNDRNLYWFHCASLGEFEQGRPIIEALKSKEDCQIVISFFSPSGYEVRKNYDQADLVFYLPLDTKQNAEKLFEFIQPTQIFIVKYEFWANLIGVSGSRSVPIYLVSGLFRDDQIFFKWYGGFFRKVLKQFTNIFVQDEASLKRLKTINIRAEVSGDTRYDRVMQNSTTAKRIELVDKFCNGKKVFVVGSSWLEDDNVLMPLVNSSIFQSKVIIAPHEINESRLKQIESQLSKSSVRFSSFSGNEAAEVLIIDNIGMLMHLYQYANVAYVGGGFKTGLHNILEPASFGVPVIFGPNHQKFPEAKLFVDNGIGFEISKAEKLIETYEALATEGKSDLVLNFMNGQTGATDYVVKNL